MLSCKRTNQYFVLLNRGSPCIKFIDLNNRENFFNKRGNIYD